MKIYLIVLFFPLYISSQIVDTTKIVSEIDSLIKSSTILTTKMEYDTALELIRYAEKLVMDHFGENSILYAKTITYHGRILYYYSKLKEAEKYYLDAQCIFDIVNGKEDPAYITNLGCLAILYMTNSDFEKSEQLYLESISLGEKVLGKLHPDYSQNLNNLGILYRRMGMFKKAEHFLQAALNIRLEILGNAHPNYAQSLNNLAILYKNMGNYKKAEALYIESKSVREKILGKNNNAYFASLNNLAILYKNMGNYEKAEALYNEAVSGRRNMLGKNNEDYANCLGNLAILYKRMGNYEAAEKLFEEEIGIIEKVFGKKHTIYSNCLSNLAILYFNMGCYEQAETLHLEAIAIDSVKFGKEHTKYASNLHNLAILYNRMGKYNKAEEYAIKAITIREGVLGKAHPEYASSLDILASIYINMNYFEKAESMLEELANLNRFLLYNATHHLSGQELMDYTHTFLNSHYKLLTFAQIQSDENFRIAQACYDNILFLKGFLLNSSNLIKRFSHMDSTIHMKFELKTSYEYRLASEYSKPIKERDSFTIAHLVSNNNNLEKDLAIQLASYGKTIQQIKWNEVQQHLKSDEAVIEFVNYNYFNKNKTDSIMYAGILVKKGMNHPQFITLFTQRSLDSLLNFDKERVTDCINKLYSFTHRESIVSESSIRSLYEILWKPIDKHLDGVKTIYFSPSGFLHRINLNAIYVDSLSTLADKYSLIELNSTRQLVIPDHTSIGNNNAMLYGGIQFEVDTTNMDIVESVALRTVDELSFINVNSTLTGGSWNYLAGTDKEVDAVEGILQTSKIKTQTLKKNQATEESFKSIGKGKPSPRVLHIATHGFFFPDPKDSSQSSVFSLQEEPVFKMSDQPMIRSGLLLSGANYAWTHGHPFKEGMEDGVLTAYEISQMNLSNTELVVLSACETGLGDIQGNEGVYGLQRAFKIAGAKYLIMSLWQIPDRETKEFMVSFYKNWLQKKKNIPDAFRQTQKEMRKRFINPFSWAGFVLVE